jgi:hypothetical protein
MSSHLSIAILHFPVSEELKKQAVKLPEWGCRGRRAKKPG